MAPQARPASQDEEAPVGQAAVLRLPARRIASIDLARGLAVTLMILSHGTKGLLPMDRFPPWGLVPIHLLTKVSSTLFMLVFGIALAVTQLRFVGTSSWPQHRRKLLVRGLVVWFWYKTLTIVEMFGLYSRREVLDTLLYKGFPVYVEILGYYSLALLWIPFALPLWKRAHPLLRGLTVPVLAGLAVLLYRHFGFWGLAPLKAILVEDPRYYTWGQLSRAPVVAVGLLIGSALAWSSDNAGRRAAVASGLALAGLALLGGFIWNAQGGLDQAVLSVARNEGKHPPATGFMLFSGGGALLILALCVAGADRLRSAAKPIVWIGSNALQAFVFHVFVVFVFYRYLFNYWHGINYPYALFLALVLIALTALWIRTLAWVRQNS